MAPSNLTEISVSELSQALKRVVESQFDLVRVRGEISGFKRAASGHLYMSLKDERAVIDAVCWRGNAGRLACKPEDGLDVVVTGRLTTYPGRSKYQLVVEQMELAGVGALMKLYEERKKKLEAEGLFDPARKRKPPFLPAVIGVVTSPTGAVIRDILHRLADRFPTHVLIAPVLVQGEGAAPQIAAAIENFNRIDGLGTVPRPDLLIVARGGGSIEDLWAFNEEIVVRAAAESGITLISAVGHETDTTLIDFASDLRAPTPTAAAELAVPVRRELRTSIEATASRLHNAADRLIEAHKRHIQGLARGLPEPRMMMGHARQRLDDQTERLTVARTAHQSRLESQLMGLASRLRSPAQSLDFFRRQLDGLGGRLHQNAHDGRMRAQDRLRQIEMRPEEAMRRHLAEWRRDLVHRSSMLESLSHQRVLERGFAIVRSTQEKQLVTSAKTAAQAPGLSIQFADGTFETANNKPRKAAQTAKPAAGQDPQGSLL